MNYNQLSARFASFVGGLGVNDWVVIVAVCVVVGIMCMRGFGSRTNY